MRGEYDIETTLEIEVAVKFVSYPGFPATRESPEEPAGISIEDVQIVVINKVDGSKLTDSLNEALTHDSDLLDTLEEICIDHASFDQERD